MKLFIEKVHHSKKTSEKGVISYVPEIADVLCALTAGCK